MEGLANSLIDSGMQCWACPVFDSLFAVISNAAGAAYQRLAFISVVIFCILFAFYVINAVWQNIKSNYADPFFQKSLKPVLIKSLLALTILSMGVAVPKMISKITFEPAAIMTLSYSKILLPQDYEVPEDYQAIQLDDKGFFNPDLRDTIIKILETSVANFQVYVKIGIAIMDEAFSLKALLGIGHLIKHILIFAIGLFLTYKFAKLFIHYSACFMDVIMAMTMFAFFFPLSVILFIFKGAQNAPKWMEKLGGSLGIGQIKKLINAIVSMASAILTYTIIMLIIRGFLNQHGVDADSIRNSAEALFDFDLENSTAEELTLAGSIVLVYVLEFIEKEIPKITDKILDIFGIKQENSLSKQMGDNMLALTEIMFNNVKQVAKTIAEPDKALAESEKKDEKAEGEKKDEKK